MGDYFMILFFKFVKLGCRCTNFIVESESESLLTKFYSNWSIGDIQRYCYSFPSVMTEFDENYEYANHWVKHF